jgi:hypothetical protein
MGLDNMEPSFKPVEPPKLQTTLLVDAMYLHAARASFQRALKQESKIEKARRKSAQLSSRVDRILSKHEGNSWNAYDELEPVYIQMESTDYRLGEAYGPQLQNLASVQILAAAALESHINSIAADKFSRSLFKIVERFSLEAKWTTVPRLLGLPGFNMGKEPYQGFATLVRFRNSLIHYKPRAETWETNVVPDFLTELGLTIGAAKRSLKSAEAIIVQLSKQRGEDPPFWLIHEEISYFDVQVGKLGATS